MINLVLEIEFCTPFKTSSRNLVIQSIKEPSSYFLASASASSSRGK